MQVPTVPVTEAQQRMQQGAMMVDVREDDEWARARVPGAVHIPMSRFMDHVGDLPGDRSVLVVCAVGQRSAQVTAWLLQQGFDASNVAGGIQAWHAEGLPLET